MIDGVNYAAYFFNVWTGVYCYDCREKRRGSNKGYENRWSYKYSILTVHTDAGYTHWTLLYDNKYYDPEFGLIEGEYTHGKITSFLEIYAG